MPKTETQQISERLRILLETRGITSDQAIQKFLYPDYERDVYEPALLHDIDRAVERIIHALKHNEKIVIYADYDADGIPGAVILHDFFEKIKYENFDVYIPHRHDEGYGLHREALEQFIADGVKLVITIDLGITAVDEVEYANSNGLDVIVTDHHEPVRKDDELSIPNAIAVVNPKLGEYPDRMLCGAAVAWKLVCALIQEICTSKESDKYFEKNIPAGWEKWLLDMVGIATLSDMVPLVHENRALAHFGLKVLRKSRRPGLRVLFQKLRMQQPYLTEDDITFMVTPKINAASRMAHPMDAFTLLTASTTRDAQVAVEHLLELNEQRKKLVAQTMREVSKTLAQRDVRDVIVIGNPAWQAGILGLVASKITEEYKRPSFVWSREGDLIKGSCRSDGTCDLVQIMQSVENHLVQFGGHVEAGGFTIEPDNIHHLEQHLLDAYDTHRIDSDNTTGAVLHELELELGEVTSRLYTELSILAPFGEGNIKPLLKISRATIESAGHFGKGQNHAKVSFVTSQGQSIEGIAFFTTLEQFACDLDEGSIVDVYGYIEESRFRGRPEIRLRLVDIISES